MKKSVYGWTSNDQLLPLATSLPTDKKFQDMRNQTRFQIELLLDCDNRKISYTNQHTENVRETNVDIGK